MVIRMRHTRGHTANRRSHHSLAGSRLSACKDCGSMHMRHRACSVCGKYRGKKVVNVEKAIEKKEKKIKDRKKAETTSG